MRAYLVTTGTVFGLITLAHIARLFAEGSGPAREPAWVILTILSAALSIWAFRLFARSRRS